jgi:hypothetical protein
MLPNPQPALDAAMIFGLLIGCRYRVGCEAGHS